MEVFDFDDQEFVKCYNYCCVFCIEKCLEIVFQFFECEQCYIMCDIFYVGVFVEMFELFLLCKLMCVQVKFDEE